MTGAGRGRVLLLCTAAIVAACAPSPSPSPPASPSVSGRATASRTAQPAAACALAGWPVERLAEQTVVVPVEETDVLTVTAEVRAGAGGVILFGAQAPPSLPTAIAAVTGSGRDGIPPFVMDDEEGGDVQRMANLVGALPSARAMAATMTPAQIEDAARALGTRLLAAGVTLDLAPVLDLDSRDGPDRADAIGTRSFGTAPEAASADGLAFAEGLRRAGVIPTVKHFPGIGGATSNSDLAPASTPPWASVRNADLGPFEDAVHAGLPAVMVGDATVPGLTDGPASLSAEAITTVLRKQMGFSGLVITDSLSAISVSAAGYTVPQAAVAALLAGADMVLFNADPGAVASVTPAVVAAIVAAVASGRLPRARLEDAVRHVLTAKHRSPSGCG